MSLTLYSLLVSFVSSIIFSMKFKTFHLRKANSGFVDEVNIGKEAIFDVYDTSTSLSVSESWDCNTEKKKHRKCDFLYVLFVFSFPRVLFFTLAPEVLLAFLAFTRNDGIFMHHLFRTSFSQLNTILILTRWLLAHHSNGFLSGMLREVITDILR